MKKNSIVLCLLLICSLAGCSRQSASEPDIPLLPEENMITPRPAEESSSSQSDVPSSQENPDTVYAGTLITDADAIVYFQSLIPRAQEVFRWFMADGDTLQLDPSETAPSPNHSYQLVGRFATTDEMLEACADVFSRRFCDSVLYPAGFESPGGLHRPLFKEIDGRLYMDVTQQEGLLLNCEMFSETSQVVRNEGALVMIQVEGDEWNPQNVGELIPLDAEFVLIHEEGRWVLDNWYHYGL